MCLGCSETLAHNEIDLSRRFGNLQLPSSVIDKNYKHYYINTGADRWWYETQGEVQEAGKIE